MELFQELNQKFQTLDRFRDIPNTSSMVSLRCFVSAWHRANDVCRQPLSLPSRSFSLSCERGSGIHRKKQIMVCSVFGIYQETN